MSDDTAVHLLAQLPDRVHLPTGDCVVARAYGIEERVGGDAVDLTLPFARLADELGDAEPAAARRGDDSLLAGHRVAVITNVPMHYRVPLFEAMHERVAAAGGEMRVLFLARRHAERAWVPETRLAFDHVFAAERHVVGELARYHPTMVVAGGFSPVAVRASAYARRRRVPLGIWSGAVDLPESETTLPRRLQRKWLLGRASFGIAYGIGARAYLARLAPSLPVVIGRNTSVHDASAEPRPLRERLELVAVGRLVERKGFRVLVEMLRRRPGLECRLTIAGDGPERARLEAAAVQDDRIVLTGGLAPDDVRRVYEAGDVFLFPTRNEVFGHVLVEAMAAGLAAVTSTSAGATADLCVDGRNALVVHGHDPGAWAAALDRLAGDPDLRARLGSRAAATVAARWTLAHSADAMIAGIRLGALVS